MHVSADHDSPIHWAAHYRKPPVIKVDGVQQRRVIEADDDAGFIVRVKTNDDGSIMHDGETVLTERVEGKVEIIGWSRWLDGTAR